MYNINLHAFLYIGPKNTNIVTSSYMLQIWHGNYIHLGALFDSLINRNSIFIL